MYDGQRDEFAELTDQIVRFRDERDWRQFHNPKDVALSLVLEATELLEIFQWVPEHAAAARSKDRRSDLQDELADILYWVLLLAHDEQIDLREALRNKLEANARKYPVERARGVPTKYTDLDQSPEP